MYCEIIFIFAPLISFVLNIKVFMTLRLLGRRSDTLGSRVRTAVLLPVAIVGDMCLCVAFLGAWIIKYVLEKYEN